MTPPPRTVLFAVHQEANGSFKLDQLFEIEKGRLHMPSGPEESENCREFPSEYYHAGTSYSLLFGGARAGTAIVKVGDQATVSFTRPMRLPQIGGSEQGGGSEMALATNSKALGRAVGSRRAPTTEERAAALRLARSYFRRKGVPSAKLAHFAVEELISTDLNHDGTQELVGSLRADESPLGREYSLFFVAERSGASYRLTLVKYHSGGGETAGFELFIDHVDLDGDGSDELITRNVGWEWFTYSVYSRRGARWIQIYDDYGCQGS